MIFYLKVVRVLSKALSSAYFTTIYSTYTIANYLITANVLIIIANSNTTHTTAHTPYNKVNVNYLDRWWLLLFKTDFTAIAF